MNSAFVLILFIRVHTRGVPLPCPPLSLAPSLCLTAGSQARTAVQMKYGIDFVPFALPHHIKNRVGFGTMFSFICDE